MQDMTGRLDAPGRPGAFHAGVLEFFRLSSLDENKNSITSNNPEQITFETPHSLWLAEVNSARAS